jgi:cytochrome c peroxidase
VDSASAAFPLGGLSDGEFELALDLGPLGAPAPDPTNAQAANPTAAWFGRYLFFDDRLSGTGTFSCATCHDPALGWGDGLQLSEAAGQTTRHAPSLWNAGHQRWLFWDGRCDSLWCQAIAPIEAAHEMAGSRLALAHTVADAPDLRAGYEAIYGPLPDLSDAARFPAVGRPVPEDPDHPEARAWASMDPEDQDAVTAILVGVSKAIAAFEASIQTGTTPVDRYVAALAAGDASAMDAALSASAQRGLKHFVGDGNCHLCHAGPLLSNREFASAGLGERPWLPLDDTGRYDGILALQASDFNAGGRWSDAPDGEAAGRIERLSLTSEQLGLFKVPSLRNVAQSPPYMHGGHFDDLTAVVQHYVDMDEELVLGHLDDFMLPLDWDAQDVADVVAFLEALTADPIDAAVLGPPDRPLP